MLYPSLYRDERCARYDAGFKQNVYAGCRIDYLLARYVYLFERSELVGKVAKVGGIVGTIIPAALLIILGIVYLASGGHSNMDFHSNFFPDFTKFDNLVLASSIFLFYAGMEMGGIHVKDVENPSVNYPRPCLSVR